MGLLDDAAAKSFKKVTGKTGSDLKTLDKIGESAAYYDRANLPGKLILTKPRTLHDLSDDGRFI